MKVVQHNILSNTLTAYIRHISNTLRFISARKKLRWKIPITFLFDRRKFNQVSAEALFHGGHLVIRNEGCTAAKLENHLKFIP